jgi:ABC-type Fe3+-hydroxamate transport system substrate-binding protein
MLHRTFKDQLGHIVDIPVKPKKIISLVPSQTELLYYLGLEKEIVGITKFCTHPKEIVKYTGKIGGTKKFDFEKIKEINPDLIIANKEENYQEGIEYLRDIYPVWTSNIYSIDDSLHMINEVGKMTGTEEKAITLSKSIRLKSNDVIDIHSGKVLYMIWQNPYMLAANNTFINIILKHLGFNNLGAILERYPEITEKELTKLNPEYVFLSSEPFPFKEKHAEHYQKLFPNAKIKLVDGEMFSWYGNRMLLAFDYFKNELF